MRSEREPIGEQGRFKVYLEQDTDAPDPRKEYDNVGTMVCWHRRYDLGDEQPKSQPDEWARNLAAEKVNASDADLIPDEHVWRILDKYFVFLPLFLYDHSGITVSTSSASFRMCDSQGWDWGRVGYIYCSMDKAREEWGNDDAEARKMAEKCLVSEVETYDQYLTGDVYGYILEDEDGEQIDSCWGFFGYEYAKEEALSILKHHAESFEEKQREEEELYTSFIERNSDL